MNIKAYFAVVLIISILLSNCVSSGEQVQSFHTTPTLRSIEILPTDTSIPTSTSIPFTETPQPGSWTVVENWTLANQIRTLLVDQSGDLWAGGPSGVVHWDVNTGKPTIYVVYADPENTNIVGLVQAQDSTIWAGTFGNGIAIFDETEWESLTTENGLPGNYIISLTATGDREIWADIQKMRYPADAGQDYYFGRFVSKKWIDEIGGGFSWVVASPTDSVVGAYNRPFVGYTFSSQVAMYDGQIWNQLTYFPYEYIEAITVAPDGVIWVATQDHIFRIVGRTLYEINPPWLGKDSPSVSSIAVAKDGTAWFGFSFSSFLEAPCGSRRSEWYEEQGVYRYDGKAWVHFTSDDGLVDNKICAIALDAEGNAWFGSYDKGISRFDGQTWKTYVIP